MALTATEAVAVAKGDLLPAFDSERPRIERIDHWLRWDHDSPHAPRQSTKEYRELAARALTPYLKLVVSTTSRGLFVDGYRAPETKGESAGWEWWQRNGMARRQIAIHRATIGYGLAYSTVLPGADSFGRAMPVIRALSPLQMLALYENPAEDDWPELAVRVDTAKVEGQLRRRVRVYDDQQVHTLLVRERDNDSDELEHLATEEHLIGVCPVVRHTYDLDLDGRATGEVEPFISTAARIDQTTFDRLVVQRFSSWVVRTIAGMSINETTAATGESAAQAKMRLRVEDILVAEDADAKFGSLPATSLDGFINAKKADIEDLSATSSTPAHELLGHIANLSAEALMAAEISYDRKLSEVRTSLGQTHGQTLRLANRIAGETEAAMDMDSQVRWRDTSGRAFAAIVDGLVKLDTIGFPREMLWEMVPDMTQTDIARAKQLAAETGGLDAMIARLLDAQTTDGDPFQPAAV